MKKIFYSVVFLAGITYTASGQRISIAPEIGVNFSTINTQWFGYSVDNGYKSGLKLGGIVDINLGSRLSLQPGIFYNGKGSENHYLRSYRAGNNWYTEDIEREIRIKYLEIPLNLMYNFGNGGFFAGGGPYIAFAVDGDLEFDRQVRLQNEAGTLIDRNATQFDLEIGDDPEEDDVTRKDLGLNFNAGYMWRKGFYLRGNVGLGLSNIVPDGNEDFSAKNFSLGLSLGYLFGR